MHSRIHEFEIISNYFEPKCKSYKSYIVAHKTTQKQFLLTRYNLQMLNMPPKVLQERLLFLCKNYKLFRCEAVFFQNHLPSFDVLNPRVISKFITIFYVVEPLPMVTLADYATANIITSDFLFQHLPNVLNTLAAMHSVRFPYLNLSPFSICFDDTLSLRPPPLNPFASEKSLMPPPPKVYRSSFRSINESRFYRAPEWESIDPFCPSDSWSLGTILAEYLVFGGPLFGSLSSEDQMRRTQMILGKAPDFLKWVPPTLTVPCDLPDIILELLDYDPNRRPWLCIHFCQRVLAFIHGKGIKNDENPTLEDKNGRKPNREDENAYSGDYSKAQQILQMRDDQEKEERRRRRRAEFDQLQEDQLLQQKRPPSQKPQQKRKTQLHPNSKQKSSSSPFNDNSHILPDRNEFLSSSYSEENVENINGTITISSPISNTQTSPISRPRRPSSSSSQSYTTSYYTYTYTTDESDKEQPQPNNTFGQTMQQPQPIMRPKPNHQHSSPNYHQPQQQPSYQSPQQSLPKQQPPYQSPQQSSPNQQPSYQSPQSQQSRHHHHHHHQVIDQPTKQQQPQLPPQKQDISQSPPQVQPQIQPQPQPSQQLPSKPHRQHRHHQKDKQPEQQQQPIENPNIQPIIQIPQKIQQSLNTSNVQFEEEEEYAAESPSLSNTYTNKNNNNNENTHSDSNSSPDTPTLTHSSSNESETIDTPSLTENDKSSGQRKSSIKTSSSYQKQQVSIAVPSSNESSTLPTPSISTSNKQEQSTSPQTKSKSYSSSTSESIQITTNYTNSASSPTANTYPTSASTPVTSTNNPTSQHSGSNEYTSTTKSSSYSYSYTNSPLKTETSKITTSKTNSTGYPYSNYESESSSSAGDQQPKRKGKFTATEETTKITTNYSQSYTTPSQSHSVSQYSSDEEDYSSNHYSFPFSSLAQDGSTPLSNKKKYTKTSSVSAPSSTTTTTTTTTTTYKNGSTYTTNTDTNTITSESRDKVSTSQMSFSSFDTSQEILNLRERMKHLENSYNQASNDENVEISIDESDSSSGLQSVVDITTNLKKRLTELDEKVLNGCNGCDITIQADQSLRRQEMILSQTLDDASGTTTATATGSSYTDSNLSAT